MYGRGRGRSRRGRLSGPRTMSVKQVREIAKAADRRATDSSDSQSDKELNEDYLPLHPLIAKLQPSKFISATIRKSNDQQVVDDVKVVEDFEDQGE